MFSEIKLWFLIGLFIKFGTELWQNPNDGDLFSQFSFVNNDVYYENKFFKTTISLGCSDEC